MDKLETAIIQAQHWMVYSLLCEFPAPNGKNIIEYNDV